MGVVPSDGAELAMAGEASGDMVGWSSVRALTSSGGSKGVAAKRRSSSSGSSWSAGSSGMAGFGGAMSMGDEATISSRRSLLLRAGPAKKRSLASKPGIWWIELVIDDDLVEFARIDAARDGALEGVALRELVPKVEALLRSRTLRENDGNLLSILLVKLGAGSSPDRRRLARWKTESVSSTSHAS